MWYCVSAAWVLRGCCVGAASMLRGCCVSAACDFMLHVLYLLDK